MNEPKKTYSVLLLDDDRFLLDMYTMKFNQSGHTVQPHFSVSEALDALRGGFDPDAVVFDLVMPDKDGFDLLRLIKEEKLAPKAILIALSNQSADEEIKKAQELGVHEFITKATKVPSEVVEAVVAAINKR